MGVWGLRAGRPPSVLTTASSKSWANAHNRGASPPVASKCSAPRLRAGRAGARVGDPGLPEGAGPAYDGQAQRNTRTAKHRFCQEQNPALGRACTCLCLRLAALALGAPALGEPLRLAAHALGCACAWLRLGSLRLSCACAWLRSLALALRLRLVHFAALGCACAWQRMRLAAFGHHRSSSTPRQRGTGRRTRRRSTRSAPSCARRSSCGSPR